MQFFQQFLKYCRKIIKTYRTKKYRETAAFHVVNLTCSTLTQLFYDTVLVTHSMLRASLYSQWPLQAQLVKDRHSLVRMGSLYSDEEEEVVEAPPEKVHMTWTREKCEAEKRNRSNAPENFRELMSLKP